MNKVLVAGSQYSLLLYWLLFDTKPSLYILNSDLGKELVNKIKNNHEVVVVKSPISAFSLIKLIYKQFIKVKLKIILKCKRLSHIDVYGGDHLLSFHAFRGNDFSVLEDGIANYLDENRQAILNGEQSIIKRVWNKIRGYDYASSFGYSENARKIYLTGLAPIPLSIQNKVELIDKQELWDAKKEAEKKEILSFFGITGRLINEFKCRKIILVTQPLEEFTSLTELEKIDVYKRVLTFYDSKNVIIKTHPRENTNYKYYFPNITVISERFPMELISLMGIRFDKIVTLCSSVALELQSETEICWLGASVHPKLRKEYGDSWDLKNFV